MSKMRVVLSRLGLCVLCAFLVVSMMGCQDKETSNQTWIPPSANYWNDEDYATEEFVKNFLAEHFAGCEYVTTKKVLVDNALAFGAWNNKTNIVSSLDDNVSFTTTQVGSFGISKKIVVDTNKPIHIQFAADFDTSLFRVYINAFDANGKSVTAKEVSKGVKQYELNVSSSDNSGILLIISATGKKDNLGHLISISAVKVWQEEEKFAVVAGVDEENVVQIIENANINGSAYFAAPNGDKYQIQVNADGKLAMVPVVPSKALFVGNSLLTGFGFGMAASDSEHDYYHLINQAISQQKPDYSASKISGTDWEKATTTAEQDTYLNKVLAPKLSEDLELVIVQLGDNVNTDEKLAVFAEGSRRMLEFIRTKCPKARVVWIGAWYQTAAKQEQMKHACESTGCIFVDIWDLATRENSNTVGSTYTDENGKTQTITSEGVASHPNDEGFRKIANKVLYKLGIVDDEEYYKKEA